MFILILLLIFDSSYGDSLVPVKKIHITGNSVFSDSEIMDILKIQYLTKTAVEEGVKRVIEQYEEAGYPFVCLQPGDFYLDGDSISFTLDIDEGVKFFVDDIRVEGNLLTKGYVIKREFRLKKTQVYNPTLIEKAKARIERLGFLSVGTIQPVTFNEGSERGYILVDVEELSSSSVEGILGYSSGGITGYFSLDVHNLFGTGRQIAGRYSSYRENRRNIFLAYREPWIMGYPVDVGVEVDNEVFDTLMLSSLKGYFNIYPLFDYTLKFGVEWEKEIPGKEEWFGIIGGELRKKELLVSLYSRFWKDGIDRLSSQVEETLNRFFFKVEGEIIFKDSIPTHKLVMVGGANSVRGYEESEIRGKAGIWSNLEYRIPIGGGSRFFPFLDLGYVDKINGPDVGMYGIGIGISFKTPIGRWSVDYGIGRDRSIAQGKLHIRLKAMF